MKKVEKYIGYYLLVYVAVLAICGFFQYLAICQGKSLECNFSLNGINTILTTTSYVLTPIIAIIGFHSWRNQEAYKKSQDLLNSIIDKVRELSKTWHLSREEDSLGRFQAYCVNDSCLTSEDLDHLEQAKFERAKINNIFIVLSDLKFLLDKFYLSSHLSMTDIDKVIDDITEELERTQEDLTTFQHHLMQLRYSTNFVKYSDADIKKICSKLDICCNLLMGINFSIEQPDYSVVINTHIEVLIKEVIRLQTRI